MTVDERVRSYAELQINQHGMGSTNWNNGSSKELHWADSEDLHKEGSIQNE